MGKGRHKMHSVGVGTPMYMAPEQQKGSQGDYNYLADMYSLGLIGLELFVGGFSTLFEMEKVFATLRKTNSIPKEYEVRIPPNARELILWLCQEDPSKRHSTSALFKR